MNAFHSFCITNAIKIPKSENNSKQIMNNLIILVHIMKIKMNKIQKIYFT